MSQGAQNGYAQGTNIKFSEGTQGQSINSFPRIDLKLANLEDAWARSEQELLARRGDVESEALAAAQERHDMLLGQLLAAAKERRDELWQQLLSVWSNKRSAKSKPQPEASPEAQPERSSDPVAPIEQSAENVEIAELEDEHVEPGERAEAEGVAVELSETSDAVPEAELEAPVDQTAEHEDYQQEHLNTDLDESEWSDSQLLDLEEVVETVTLSELRLLAGCNDNKGGLNEIYEQDESEDSGFELDEPEMPEQPQELDEEPPRKRSRLLASQQEERPSSSGTREKFAPYTKQQKDHIRALICKTLGTRSLPVEGIEPVAQIAGLTVKQVRKWISQFYQEHPEPALEQAMAWRSGDTSHRDILNEWLMAHRDYPYPSLKDKERLARETGKTLEKVDSWFSNARFINGLTSNRNFSPNQTAALRASFEENIYPSAGEKQRLASETGLSAKQVDMWFNIQRQRKGLTAQKEFSTDQKAPLFAWLHANMQHPHPNTNKKKELAKESGLTLEQIRNWFRDSRVRIARNQGKEEYEGRCPCCGAANV